MAAIAAIVILPILGILVLAEAKWVHKELPYLGETAVAADGTKEYHTVSDINLINQHGKPITLYTLNTPRKQRKTNTLKNT